jgi:hypothetical protein
VFDGVSVACVTEYLQQLQKRLLLPFELTVVAFNSRNVLFITGVVSVEHKTNDRLAVREVLTFL